MLVCIFVLPGSNYRTAGRIPGALPVVQDSNKEYWRKRDY